MKVQRGRNNMPLLLVFLAISLLCGCGGTQQEIQMQEAEIPVERSVQQEIDSEREADVGSTWDDEASLGIQGDSLQEAETEEEREIADFAWEGDEIHSAVEVELNDDAMVIVKDYIPNIQIDLRYATEHNFTGQRIYDFADVYLRYGTVKKLRKVQGELADQGMSLKIWDGFRPVLAQFTLWDAYPDASYVANPYQKYSSHSTGGCVDLTLAYADGSDVVMPTDFDDFTSRADRDYSDCSSKEAEHAELLEELMKENGFRPYEKEWWHFTDIDGYPVETEFVPEG